MNVFLSAIAGDDISMGSGGGGGLNGQSLSKYHMWHDQGEWVGCRIYCFWDIGKERVQIPLFDIVFSMVELLTTL